MTLMDRTFTKAPRDGLATRVARGIKAAWERYVARLKMTELTEAKCRDAGIDWGALERERVKRGGLIR